MEFRLKGRALAWGDGSVQKRKAKKRIELNLAEFRGPSLLGRKLKQFWGKLGPKCASAPNAYLRNLTQTTPVTPRSWE